MNVVKGKKTTNPKHATKEQSEHALPVLDRNFFYACLIACTSCKARRSTMCDSLTQSVSIFDAQRNDSETDRDDADFIH